MRGGRGGDKKALVSCRADVNPVNPNTLTGAIASLVRRPSIPNMTFHGVRHTHATQLLKDGVRQKVVQERLGHSTVSTTLALYSHVMPGMQEDAALRVDKALKAALGRRADTES